MNGPELQPTPPPAVPTSETVHFSRRSKRTSKVEQYVRQWTMFSLLGAGGLVFSLALLLARFSLPVGSAGLRKLALAVLAPALCGIAGAVVGIWVWRQRKRRTANLRALPDEPDEAYRIRWVGSPDAVHALGGPQDVPFEPAVWWASLSVPPTGWALAAVWIAAAILGVAASLGTRWLHLRRWTGDPGPFDVWAAYGLCWAVYAWFRPVYYRVVPGRLDVVRYTAFCTRPQQLQRYDLKASRVLIDTHRSLLFIDHPAGGVELSFAVLAGRSRFAYQVLLGALSTHSAGPLPDDELIG